MLEKLKIYTRKITSSIIDKLNPAQPIIHRDEMESYSLGRVWTYKNAYEKVEVVNRGTNLIVDLSSGIYFDVGDKLHSVGQYNLRQKKLNSLVNFQPNPYYNINLFRRNIYLDLILEGNAFIYFDGSNLYNLPSEDVKIVSDPVTYVDHYEYQDEQIFKPYEIIHIKDNSSKSVFRGASRLMSANDSIKTLADMLDFQQNLFKNGAVPGLVLKSPNILGRVIKDRIVSEWQQRYNPKSGGRRPVVLDGGLDVGTLNVEYDKLDFSASVTEKEDIILEALGVPPILLKAGNNANILPNLKLFYITTIIPLVEKVTTAFEHFFGYDLKLITQNILALRPELRDEANYLTTLTNAGILTRNESREMIRKPPAEQDFADELILPANVAGSAASPNTQGGRPQEDNQNQDNSSVTEAKQLKLII